MTDQNQIPTNKSWSLPHLRRENSTFLHHRGVFIQ